jgi:hypothetical protein
MPTNGTVTLQAGKLGEFCLFRRCVAICSSVAIDHCHQSLWRGSLIVVYGNSIRSFWHHKQMLAARLHAEDLAERKLFKEAASAFQRCVQLAPCDPQCHEMLAQCLMEAEDYAAAHAAASSATQIAPQVCHTLFGFKGIPNDEYICPRNAARGEARP